MICPRFFSPFGKLDSGVLATTSLGDRFVVLVVSVLWGRCAIPVAWCVLPAVVSASWKEEWLRLFRLLAPAIPSDMLVIVCADRGLYVLWLFEAIQERGWHPFFRVNKQGTFRCEGESAFRPLWSYGNSHYAVPIKLGVVLPLPLSPSPKKGGETVHKRCASSER
jgi:hypothetical protein